MSETQRARQERNRRTIAAARMIDLGNLKEAEMIELIERLRAGLDDSVLLNDEVTE
ncbi:hypothetical protein [Streptomyces sp. NPDC093093]|uniref:hypothetical protein n=1 Tax=Streptomyces sp. NPDC093093 TaxID=3366025 RepID=UPI003828C122